MNKISDEMIIAMFVGTVNSVVKTAELSCVLMDVVAAFPNLTPDQRESLKSTTTELKESLKRSKESLSALQKK